MSQWTWCGMMGREVINERDGGRERSSGSPLLITSPPYLCGPIESLKFEAMNIQTSHQQPRTGSSLHHCRYRPAANSSLGIKFQYGHELVRAKRVEHVSGDVIHRGIRRHYHRIPWLTSRVVVACTRQRRTISWSSGIEVLFGQAQAGMPQLSRARARTGLPTRQMVAARVAANDHAKSVVGNSSMVVVVPASGAEKLPRR